MRGRRARAFAARRGLAPSAPSVGRAPGSRGGLGSSRRSTPVRSSSTISSELARTSASGSPSRRCSQELLAPLAAAGPGGRAGRAGRLATGRSAAQPRSISRRRASATSPSSIMSSASASTISSAVRSGTACCRPSASSVAARGRARSRRRRRSPTGEVTRSEVRKARSGIGGLCRSSPVDHARGAAVLVQAALEVEALEQELDGRGDERRLLARRRDGRTRRAARPPRARPGTSRIQRTYSRDGTRSPVSMTRPSSNASTTRRQPVDARPGG